MVPVGDDERTPAYRARTRLYVANPLMADGSIVLGRDATHYLRDVLRLKLGDELCVFNQRDGEWTATLSHVARNEAMIALRRRLREPKTEPDLWLLFALDRKSVV